MSNTAQRSAQAFESSSATCPRKASPRGVAYHDVGQGEPLVLVHGVGMRLEAWSPQIPEFARTHRVIAVDMPGHGESKALPAGSTIKDFVAWLERFLDDIGLSRVNIAGHSMGAMISGGAVATFPERIARVAYLNGVHKRDPDAKAAVLARAAAIRSSGVDKEGPLLRWFGDDPESNRARELTRAWLEQIDPQAYATAYSAFATGDDVFCDCWPKVTCPAMFLTGDGDPNSTPEMAKTMATQAQNGWARIISGHRHMVNLTAPGIVNDMMREWLATEERPT
ncbi:alpha/beta fold hydrolase [Rhizobium sp. YTU87027]|uniref:alpha/beta fold hydrolase n=1 Tax=Rhizobium sp. YTU87027 TaxID=3417741 RepID=UPI003D68C09A